MLDAWPPPRQQGNMGRALPVIANCMSMFNALPHVQRATLAASVAAVGLLACRREAPETPVAAPASTQAPAPVAAESVPPPRSPRMGWSSGRVERQTIDVLVRADAPGLEPGPADGAIRPVADAWRSLGGVEHVVTRAREGEVRALIRFDATAQLPDAATAAVASAWQAHRPPELATPQIAWIPRGNRARLGWAFTSFDGGEDATALAVQVAPQLLQQWPALARTEVAGTVRPVFFVDVLTKSVQDRGSTLAMVAAGVRNVLQSHAGQTKVDAGPQSQNILQAAVDTGKIGVHDRGAPVELSRVVALRRGLGGPVRSGLVGRNEAVLLRGEMGVGGEMGNLEAKARAELAAAGHLGARRQVYPQTLAVASRLVLDLRADQTPERPVDLAKRLLVVREMPGVVGVAAMQGLDGIPEPLDSDVPANRRWTVWVTVSTPNAEALITSIAGQLGEGPWQAYSIPGNLDTSLAWLLDRPAAAGALVAARDPAQLAPAVAALGEQLKKHPDFANLRSGPQRRGAVATFARLRVDNLLAAHLPSDDAALALNLVDRPQPIGVFGGADVWLGLPTGAMAAEYGTLPLAWLPPANRPALLGDIIQLPSDMTVLERLRVDGDPALWVQVDNHGMLPDVAVTAFRDAFERASIAPTVQRLGLTVADPTLGLGACVP